jgi:hypothetical protein
MPNPDSSKTPTRLADALKGGSKASEQRDTPLHAGLYTGSPARVTQNKYIGLNVMWWQGWRAGSGT